MSPLLLGIFLTIYTPSGQVAESYAQRSFAVCDWARVLVEGVGGIARCEQIVIN